MNGFVLQNNKNIWYGSFAAFDALGFGNAFSCRLAWRKRANIGGLNLALHVGDEAGLVLKNRRAYAAALGLDAGKFTCCEQVHGSNVAVVDEALEGKGAEAYSDAVKKYRCADNKPSAAAAHAVFWPTAFRLFLLTRLAAA